MRLAGNLTWLYPDLPWAARFDAAARDGFRGVEILLPYDESPAWYAQQLRASGLELALFNTPVTPGAGRLGWAAVPGAEASFREAFDAARGVAAATGCRTIHVMAGHVADHDAADCAAALRRNLSHALALAEADDLTLALEALNRDDMPGYFYARPAQVIEVLRGFASPRLRLQFDYYHCMKEGLDLAAAVRDCAPWTGHAQIAGVDGRHEPDLSQHGLEEAVASLADLGYDGWLGCEYAPRGQAAEGLAWAAPLRARGVLA
ncbi:TIM barrel protein [Ramlibacter sp. USB13]|uniref:TIM barrel protein n=2 Tax=Ramlibacter cellulosilyticus TaxID=2764187 RepID=A0A923MSX5_9BURK|nr:TIM barrel protein [Ramlibacter cellulosilyticus]